MPADTTNDQTDNLPDDSIEPTRVRRGLLALFRRIRNGPAPLAWFELD